jgi:hypothetical protein
MFLLMSFAAIGTRLLVVRANQSFPSLIPSVGGMNCVVLWIAIVLYFWTTYR